MPSPSPHSLYWHTTQSVCETALYDSAVAPDPLGLSRTQLKVPAVPRICERREMGEFVGNCQLGAKDPTASHRRVIAHLHQAARWELQLQPIEVRPEGDPQVGIASIFEGTYENGQWTAGRRLNGDEDDQGAHWQFSPEAETIERVTLYSYGK